MSRTNCAISGARSGSPTARRRDRRRRPSRRPGRACARSCQAAGAGGTATTHAAMSRSTRSGAAAAIVSATIAAERQPAHRRSLDPQRGRGGRSTSPARSAHRVRPGRHRRATVAAQIDRDDAGSRATAPGPAAPTSRSDVPIAWIEDDDRGVDGAVDPVVKRDGASSMPAIASVRSRAASTRSGASPTSSDASGPMLRAIASGRTTRCSRLSRSQAAAESTVISSWRIGTHSACQLPAARSCSWAIEREQGRHEPDRALRAGHGRDRGDRIVLVRHGRGATAPGDAFLDFGDLGLGEQDDVPGGFRDRTGRHAKGRGEVADARSLRVPRGDRDRQAESIRHLAPRSAGPLPPKPARVPAAPPSWTASPVRRIVGEPIGRAVEAQHPVRGLQAERRRDRLLQQGSPGDRRRSMGGARAARPPSEAPARSSRIASRRCARCSIVALSTMSWLVAPRWTEPATSGPTAARSRSTRATTGVPVADASRAIARGVEDEIPRDGLDARGVRLGDEPDARAGRGQRDLDLDHRVGARPRPRRSRPPDRAPTSRRACAPDQRSKKAVSPSPWRRMSKR